MAASMVHEADCSTGVQSVREMSVQEYLDWQGAQRAAQKLVQDIRTAQAAQQDAIAAMVNDPDPKVQQLLIALGLVPAPAGGG